MAAVLEQFFRDLSESRLIPAEEVTSLQKALKGSKAPPTVQEVAKLLVQSGKLTEYQAATISQGRPQSLILGEYVLLNVLGKGGMGVVFLARHRLMDRVVALKTLPSAAIKPETVQRFYREVKAAARLSHPNIVTAFDAGEQAGTHYLVMEYVVGRDLAAIVKENGPLPLRQAIDYVQQAARGLDFAHKHGVVHRDIKPRNLLLDQEGVVKILDMGLARLNEDLVDAPEAAELTGAGQILGTVDYMSPEQAEDVRSADRRSDIYSLGCTLFYLLTRRPVYGGETILKRILCHRDEPVPSVMELRPDCPARLDAAIQWMLAKRPEDRPQTMAEVIVELENCLENPEAAPPLTAPMPEGSDSVRNWLEDLASDEPSPSTEDSQYQEATHGSPPADGLPSGSLQTSPEGSSIRRSKQSLHRLGAKKSLSAAGGRKVWKIVIAATAAAVLVAASVTAWFLGHADRDTTAKEDSAAKAESGGAAALDGARSSGSGTLAPSPNRPIQGSAWQEAWTAAKGRADGLVAQRRFGNAIHEYGTLAGRFKDVTSQQRCNEAIHRIEAEADAAFQKVETVAREYLRQRQFAQARSALEPALATYGPVPAAARARKLLEEIDQAGRRAASPPVKTAETAKVQEPPALPPELLKQRQLDATFAKAIAGVESRVAGWDFQGAARESEAVRFDSPELTARLASRREQVQRMADLKAHMIAAINQADPHLTKTDLALRGINGELNKADAEGIAATLLNGKAELIVWPGVGPKALQKLLQRVVRGDDAGDCLAAGLLSLAVQDAPSAERYFDKARSLGVETAPYRALLATREFAAIRELLDKRKYAESAALLTALEKKYGSIPWFTSNKPELDAAAKVARRGLREKEAEGMYAQAAGLFRNGDLYELKAVVALLKSQYADSAVVVDSQRKPSVAEFEKAVADLGPLVRVRKDGKGDVKTIQEAIKMATGNAKIQIEEVGPWAEQITVPAEKEGLTICGKKGILPVLTTAGAANSYSETFLIHSPQLLLERLAIVRADSAGAPGIAITADTTSLSLRGGDVYGHLQAGKGVAVKDCVFFGHVGFRASGSLQNALVCGGVICGSDSQLRHCTIAGPLHLTGMPSVVSDCIVSSINAPNAGHTVEHCDVFGINPLLNQAALGKGCLKLPPQFADANSLDFRLLPGSHCRKAASDGSDMGFTCTAEIQALLKALDDLRNRARGKL